MTASDSISSRPSQDAIDKLNVIPVFVIAKSPTELCLSEQNGVTVVPLYLSKQAADEALSAYNIAISDYTASVIYFSLDKMYQIIEVFKDDYSKQSKEIVFPIVVKRENTQKALEILRNEGHVDSSIQAALSIPVFFTEPIITIDSHDSGGAKNVFFIDFADMKEAMDRLPSTVNPPIIKVANLDQVIGMISDSNDKNFEIYPSREYFSLKKIFDATLELQG
jgi:hypothetical protein